MSLLTYGVNGRLAGGRSEPDIEGLLLFEDNDADIALW